MRFSLHRSGSKQKCSPLTATTCRQFVTIGKPADELLPSLSLLSNMAVPSNKAKTVGSVILKRDLLLVRLV